jgi:hypothetical protein
MPKILQCFQYIGQNLTNTSPTTTGRPSLTISPFHSLSGHILCNLCTGSHSTCHNRYDNFHIKSEICKNGKNGMVRLPFAFGVARFCLESKSVPHIQGLEAPLGTKTTTRVKKMKWQSYAEPACSFWNSRWV